LDSRQKIELEKTGLVGNKCFTESNQDFKTLRHGYCSIHLNYMHIITKRLITYILGFFFLFSSLGYACPDLNSLAKQQHDSSVADMASDENPCQDSDHDVNPLCQYILHDRIWYKSPKLSVDKVVSRIVFYVTETTNDFDATAVFRTATASEFHSKLSLTLLHHVLRV